jgi:hypothetical protein
MKFRVLSLAGLLGCALALGMGCQSRFEESSPASVKMKGLPLAERLSQKEKIDARISEVQRVAEKIKLFIEMFKKVKKPSTTEDAYTPIDFLIDANKELQTKIPDNQNEKKGRQKLVRRARVIVPVNGLSEDCRVIDTLLESSPIYEDGTDQSENPDAKPVGERLTYSVRTCGTKEQFLVAMEAEWIGDTLEFRLVNKNLDAIFRNLISEEALKNSVCKVSQGQKKIVETIRCSDFGVRLTQSEAAWFQSMTFSNSGEIRFEASAAIFENGRHKADGEIKIPARGKPIVEFRPVAGGDGQE